MRKRANSSFNSFNSLTACMLTVFRQVCETFKQHEQESEPQLRMQNLRFGTEGAHSSANPQAFHLENVEVLLSIPCPLYALSHLSILCVTG